MRNRKKLEIKYVVFEKLVRLFGLEKAERIFKIFDCKSSKK